MRLSSFSPQRNHPRLLHSLHAPAHIAAAFFALTTTILIAQAPAAAYRIAHERVRSHSAQDGFLLDNSSAAQLAIRDQWAALAAFLSDLRDRHPGSSAADLGHSLCLLTAEPSPPEAVQQTPEEQCKPDARDPTTVLDLAPGLLLVAPFSGEIGTVFILGGPPGKSRILWSIGDAAQQARDPDDLVGAWRPDRASDSCRRERFPHKPGSCGPLYASIGLLPPDTQHRPRFFLDASYAQWMGATIASQRSIWRWDNDHATLQWIDRHDFMIDDAKGGASFADGIFTVTYKGYFRTMFDCGACNSRPTQHRILVQPSGVLDLGTRSLAPELDLIDTLFWRIAHHRSTASIAAPAVVRTLGPELRQTFHDSRKIQPGWDSLGMIDGMLVRHTAGGAQVCLQPDSVDATFHFSLRRTLNGGYFISGLHTLHDGSACSEPPVLPWP